MLGEPLGLALPLLKFAQEAQNHFYLPSVLLLTKLQRLASL